MVLKRAKCGRMGFTPHRHPKWGVWGVKLYHTPKWGTYLPHKCVAYHTFLKNVFEGVEEPF